jgi:hypothetical protein
MYTVFLVAAMLTASFGLLRLAGWARRRRALSKLDPAQIVRIERGVSVRIRLAGTRALHGMDPRRAHLAQGDLALTHDRVLLGSTQGVLADIGPQHGRKFRSARCTGPGRLVIEGDLPGPTGVPSLYRFDLVVADAEGWATALQPFVEPNSTGAQFAVVPGAPLPR